MISESAVDLGQRIRPTEVKLMQNALENAPKTFEDVGVKFKSQQRTNSKIRTVQTFRMVMDSLCLQGLVHTPPVRF